MRPKTIIMLLMVILLTMMLLQIVYSANVTMIFTDVSKTNMILAAIVIAFILGYMIGHPGSRKKFRHFHHDNPDDAHPDTLSEEDRRYID